MLGSFVLSSFVCCPWVFLLLLRLRLLRCLIGIVPFFASWTGNVIKSRSVFERRVPITCVIWYFFSGRVLLLFGDFSSSLLLRLMSQHAGYDSFCLELSLRYLQVVSYFYTFLSYVLVSCPVARLKTNILLVCARPFYSRCNVFLLSSRQTGPSTLRRFIRVFVSPNWITELTCFVVNFVARQIYCSVNGKVSHFLIEYTVIIVKVRMASVFRQSYPGNI